MARTGRLKRQSQAEDSDDDDDDVVFVSEQSRERARERDKKDKKTDGEDFERVDDDDDDEVFRRKKDEEVDDFDLDAAMPQFFENALPESVLKDEKSGRLKFEANDLAKEEGLAWVLERLPKVAAFSQKSETRDAMALVEGYRTWAKKLFPKLPFDDFAARVDKFGQKQQVRNLLESMREDFVYGRLRKQKRHDDDSDPEEVMLPEEKKQKKKRKSTEENKEEEEDSDDDVVVDLTERKQHQDEEEEAVLAAAPVVVPSALDEEKKRKIEANRLAALEKRKLRIAAAEKARSQPEVPAPPVVA